MAFDTAYPQILANLTAGNEPVAIIDSNFTPLYNALNALNTFGNYYVDSGAADAYVITITARQTLSLAAGLPIQFKAGNANTGASTLNANGSGAKNILNMDGTALAAGQIRSGGIAIVMYDGTQYQLLNPFVSKIKRGTFTRDMSLTTDLPITGLGFRPREVDFWMGFGSSSDPASIGTDDGVAPFCSYNFNGTAAGRWLIATAASIVYYISAGVQNIASIKTLDADGYTLQFSKSGSPTATPTIMWRARQ